MKTKYAKHDAVTKRIPNTNILQMFGSLCYGYQHHIHKNKYDPMALPDVFLGYDPRSPAKLLYFPNENKIHKVKDVKFTIQL